MVTALGCFTVYPKLSSEEPAVNEILGGFHNRTEFQAGSSLPCLLQHLLKISAL